MKSFNNFINGKEVPARDGRTTPVIDPVTGEQYATAALSGANDVNDAMKAAAVAAESWKNTTPAVRQKAINDIADVMEKHMTELIEAEIENTGKPRAITFSEEVPPMMDQIRFFAGAARMLEGKSAGEDVATAVEEGAPAAELKKLCGELIRAARAADGWR